MAMTTKLASGYETLAGLGNQPKRRATQQEKNAIDMLLHRARSHEASATGHASGKGIAR